MKLKNEVFNNVKFNETINKLNETDLPAKLAYKIFNLSKELTTRIEGYNKVREDLLKKYGTFNEEKEQYTFDGENAKKFNNQFKELLEEEFDVEFEPQELPDNVTLTPSQIASVESLFIF